MITSFSLYPPPPRLPFSSSLQTPLRLTTTISSHLSKLFPPRLQFPSLTTHTLPSPYDNFLSLYPPPLRLLLSSSLQTHPPPRDDNFLSPQQTFPSPNNNSLFQFDKRSSLSRLSLSSSLQALSSPSTSPLFIPTNTTPLRDDNFLSPLQALSSPTAIPSLTTRSLPSPYYLPLPTLSPTKHPLFSSHKLPLHYNFHFLHPYKHPLFPRHDKTFFHTTKKESSRTPF